MKLYYDSFKRLIIYRGAKNKIKIFSVKYIKRSKTEQRNTPKLVLRFVTMKGCKLHFSYII